MYNEYTREKRLYSGSGSCGQSIGALASAIGLSINEVDFL